MQQLSIPVILGTDREGRNSEKPVRWVHDMVQKRGIKSEFIDPREFAINSRLLQSSGDAPLPKEFEKWHAIAQAADGFIIVTPEYNHGYPGVLKILLDELYKEYNYKPVAICGVSEGTVGGARAVELLKLVAVEMKMIPLRPSVFFGKVEGFKPQDHEKKLNGMLDELVWYAEIMKSARAKKKKV